MYRIDKIMEDFDELIDLIDSENKKANFIASGGIKTGIIKYVNVISSIGSFNLFFDILVESENMLYKDIPRDYILYVF